MTSWDAVVVGAGPAGSATARHLARGGARVLLLDRERFPRHKPCSEYLSPETTRLLERLGSDVLAAVERAAPARLYGMQVVAPNGAAMCGRFDRPCDDVPPPPRPYSYALPRATFDLLLRDAAERAGAVVRDDVAVDDLLFEHGAVAGVVTRTPGGGRDAIRARVVVGADGLNSVVARRLGVARRSPPYRIAFTAHVGAVAEMGDVGELHVSDCGYVGMGPIGGDVTTVALVLPLGVVRRRDRDFRATFFQELERFPRLRGRFDPRRLVREVLPAGPFARWTRRAVADQGGALLVGDAADFFDPFTGQGIYSALRGAELAADTLLPALTNGTPLTRAALLPYRAARRAVFGTKWVLERLIGFGVGWPALTNRVVRRLEQYPGLADLMVGATGNFVPAGRLLTPGVLARLLS
ncbi:MAG TPA: NAD(P)/FAD-dependent oxidoreductase [Gemmatimonadales bacterium]|nr:NAD(P)/FAD-dependent oxidoreductase [Gemmatimonadales bacterium]